MPGSRQSNNEFPTVRLRKPFCAPQANRWSGFASKPHPNTMRVLPSAPPVSAVVAFLTFPRGYLATLAAVIAGCFVGRAPIGLQSANW
jgi:hypothetical protein